MTRAGAKAKRRPVVERQGFDVAEWTLKKILPGAVELCDKGIENEKRLERDPQRYQRRVIDYYDTIVWADHGNGVAVPTRMLETCERQTVLVRFDRQPVNIPILRAESEAQLHWALYVACMRAKIFGNTREANAKARELATKGVSFRHIGSKESSVMRPGGVHTKVTVH